MTGATPFRAVVTAFDAAGAVDQAFAGTQAIITLANRPNDYVQLLPTVNVAATFTAGIATFTGLRINTAWATKYNLTASMSGTSVQSSGTLVTVGQPTGAFIFRQPGTATGGVPFQAQPCIRILDAGGNLVATAPNSTVVAKLSKNPAGGTLSGDLTGTISNGSMCFTNLVIEKAGDGYEITFTTTFAIGTPALVSNLFNVGIGPTAGMRVSTQPAGVTGGLPFPTQPITELIDAGGNINTDDSSSNITVAIRRNPVGGVLTPLYLFETRAETAALTAGSRTVTMSGATHPAFTAGDLLYFNDNGPWTVYYVYSHIREVTLSEAWTGANVAAAVVKRRTSGVTRTVNQGVVSWTGLTIDKAGEGYTLSFTSSLKPSGLTAQSGIIGHGYGYGGGSTNATIWVESGKFDVKVGPEAKLVIRTPFASAWASNQPVLQQAIVAVADAGGNTVNTLTGRTLSVAIKGTNTQQCLLVGVATVSTQEGLAAWDDVGFTRQGPLTLEFTDTVKSFKIEQSIVVDYSGEWEVRIRLHVGFIQV